MSTLRLRDWLEKLRTNVEAAGTIMPRPEPTEGEASERSMSGLDGSRLYERDYSPEFRTRAPNRQRSSMRGGCLRILLDWHRREDKAGWWKYYRLRELPEEDLFDEPRAVAGLEHVERLDSCPHATRPGSPRGRSLTAIDIPAQNGDSSER